MISIIYNLYNMVAWGFYKKEPYKQIEMITIRDFRDIEYEDNNFYFIDIPLHD